VTDDHSPHRPFRRVLIANRGEIALRVIRACRELGMEAVAVYSEVDAGAAHVRAADQAVLLGPASPSDSYLRLDRVVEAARHTGADAVHPGYGFLAERAEFARAVEEAGIAFVGPSSRAISALGDKLAARRVAREVGVPVVPGTFDPAPVDRAEDVESILAQAREVGLPLLVKASAGGGGRGMRRVERLEELPAALVAGSREAAAAFGDGAVYLEREVRPARHVEVQLLGDHAGTVVAVGERDCSIQRRHQKLIEEAPAPGLTIEQRRTVHGLAVRAATVTGLSNAATAEFLLDPHGRFWFLEVNARLQVEHGVTELVSGLDLVREQFFIAAGRPLSEEVLAAAAVAAEPRAHAIQVRLLAEDPARSFAPTPGRVGTWVMPAGPGVRVDTAINAGERIPPEYDPMIAKIMVVAADRDRAVVRLRRALDEVEVTGIQTTLPFARGLARHPAFRAEDLSTGWVADHWDPTADRERARDIALRTAARLDGTVPTSSAGPATGGQGVPAGRETPGTTSASPASGWATAGRRAGVDRWPS
jgi:acetyl/propionyl-CoA carboxylase alpha subunit